MLPVVKGADSMEERAPALVSHWPGSGSWLCHVTLYHTLLCKMGGTEASCFIKSWGCHKGPCGGAWCTVRAQ